MSLQRNKSTNLSKMKCGIILILAVVAMCAAHPVDPEQIVDQLMDSRYGEHFQGSRGNYVIFALNMDNQPNRDSHDGGHHNGGSIHGVHSTVDRRMID